MGLAVAFASQAAEYTLDFRGAAQLAAEAPVTRRAEMPVAVGQIPSVAVGDTLNLQLFEDVALLANVTGVLPGSFLGGKSFSLTLEDGVFGSTLIENANGLFLELRDIGVDMRYSVSVRDGKAYIEETDLSLVRRGDCISLEAPELEAEEESEAVPNTKRQLLGVAGNPFDDNAVALAPVMVDIMLVFDNGARAWTESQEKYGGSITNFAIAQVAKMNQVLRNTDLHTNFWFRLVDVATVDGRWTKIDDTILPAMRTGVMNASGIWSEISARREACGADVVSLIVDTGSAYGTTGIGYITHGTSYNTWVNTYRTWCYSCCAIRSVENDYTLSHEVGHNMGLTHSPTLATWNKVGTFDYSNGYNITNANDGKHYNTIMAYNYDRYFSDYIEIPYYSSPDYTFKGVPLGTAISNDCTRALRQTCIGIADWHTQTIPLPSDIAFSPNSSSTYRISLSTLGDYEIRYTTDGSEPTRESTLYEGPIKLTSGEMTIKAVAVVDGETLGAVATKTYTAAVELDEYVWLEDTTEKNWSNGNWNRNDGSYIYYYFWNSSSDKTAVLDVDGDIKVDRDISLATLVAGGTTGLEIDASQNSLFATNLEVVGAATLSGTKYSFDNWKLYPESTLLLAPGNGQEATLGKYLSRGAAGSTLAISNGTFKVTKGANSGDGTSTLQNTSVRIDSGGILSLDGGWILGFSNPYTVTVNKGGLLRINKLESTTRPLILNGGNVEINLSGRACELRSMSMSVTDDSSIIDVTAKGEADIYLYEGDASIDVLEDKKLTIDARITTSSDNKTKGRGIRKSGKGEIRFLREVTHTGTNTVNAGTFTVAYNSTASDCLHWSIASGAALKIEQGCSLQVPSLALSHGSALVLPAASSAPLTVSGAVDLTHVALTLTDADDLSYGKTYPLLSSSEDITGLARAYKSEFPTLADGLAWKLYVENNTLFAKVLTVAEASEPVVLVSNNPDLVLEIPDTGIVKYESSVKIETAPLAVDDLNTKAVAITMDVEIPTGAQSAEATLCSWNVGDNIVRCVRRPDGKVDCFYGESSHVDNGVDYAEIAPGRHTINVGYYSLGNDNYGGTFVYVDGVLAYRGAKLRWSSGNNDSVSLVTFGATAAETPTFPYDGLVVKGVAVIEPFSALPVSGMTASGGEVTYNYVVPTNKVLSAYNKLPSVFGSAPGGGFTMYSTCLDAALPDNYDSISVSIVATFPADKLGALMGIWTKNTSTGEAYTSQVDYNGDGTFATRYNGYVAQNPATVVGQPDVNVESPHLYTFTYTKNEGFRFYQDGAQILEATDGFTDKGYLAYYKVTFGCGPWNKWTTAYDDSDNPMPNFKVYSSHIALGTDELLASADPAIESLNFSSAYDEMSIAEKLSYLPKYQTAFGVAAPDESEDPETDTPDDPEPPATPAVVDVLVAYDNGAQAYVANKSVTLAEFAATQIQKMNDVLVTNRLDRFYSYRLAGICRVDGAYDDINAAPALAAEGAGAAVSLRAARELYGADTVTLLVDTTGATLGNSSPLNSTNNVASQHECAFSVCSIRAVDTGKQHTMIHENAHNMGCGHARSSTVPEASPFEYGRGYYFKDGDVTRHTIMAYGGDNDASWYFSTTSKEFGFTLGDKTNNNARVLKETCAEVAKWRENGKPSGDGLTVTDENGNAITSECFFSDRLKVTVAAPVEGAELYYTFDGSEPIVDEESWHQTSPFTFNFNASRTLKIAYYDGGKMSPARTIKVNKCTYVPAVGLWQTGLKYPWSVDGDTIRSYNQTDYTYQCTTPLKATIVGPKKLTFKHKSYFGGESVGGSNYSHFDVLLDDSPVLTQTECTNSWTDASVTIPEGTHEVMFVFSQRFAMNNTKDYKDGEPEDDDAVWLKDFALTEIPTCRHTSTSDNVTWTFPSDAIATSDYLGGIILANNGIKETLGFGSTNAVVLSVLAELPEGGEGALMGLVDVNGDSRHPIYAYANGDGTFTIYYDSKSNTTSSVSSPKLDATGLHLWTLAYYYNEGAKLYLDGVEVASDAGIKWTGTNYHKPAECLTFGSAYTNAYPLAGMKIYSVHSDFGSEAFFNATNTPASNASIIFEQFEALSDYADESTETKLALLSVYNELGYIPSKDDPATTCVLRISEIMPKPTDAQDPGSLEGMDVNKLESGWVEVENTSDQWADLADYRFIRVNRGKKTDPVGYGNFPSRLVPPRGRAIFYTSERYSNGKKDDKDEVCKVSAFAEGTFDGKPMIFEDYGNILVWGDKVNPKKSPYVRLYYAPVSNACNIVSVVDTVVIPSDLPEGWSIIVGDAAEGEGTRRWMCPTPTRGRANTATAGLTRIGPNVGPLYERPDQKKTDLASEFAAITPPAVPGTDYTVTLPINAVMNPDGTFTPRTADQIQSIKFVCRKDLDDTTLVTNAIDMATKTVDENWGDQYTATIPASYFPAAGHLIQWKVLITDGEGVKWTSPSFNNPDDGYEWYGTIVEAPGLESATLPTWHMFADEASTQEMDYDTVGDSKRRGQDKSLVPNFARVAIYDSSTSNYYDYVRIDLRGNTSANFTKKGHGLRFAKAHPLTMRDIVSGEDIKEIRKTSLISEFADPSYMRQMIAFWLWRKMGNLVPFDFPVRCNLNGEFYQLAFNSERFTDELIEDVYGLDKFGYSYKNVGTMKSGSTTTAGKIEKKTPDDEDESNITVLQNELRSKITEAQNVPGTSEAAKSSTTTDTTGLDNVALTKFVVQKFDLPAWLNYLASARITQEMDDVWANVCAYYDNPEMKEGSRGTGTWMPLGYDFNLSLGQYYYNDIKDYGNSRDGLMATNDWFKSHPFYGGNRVVAYRNSSMSNAMSGNDGFEAVWQSAKFRRLYLRRLRTLMDQELKEPDTPESDTPFMSKMREMAGLMRADAMRDQEKWTNDGTDDAIDVWPSGTRPENMDAGIDEIWNNYVVPRREHLYVTHSVTNTAKVIGYGSNLNAGIPEAQSPISVLAQNFVIAKLSDCVVISNLNNEVVDMSGWTLKFGVEWTLPAGTVCDSNDCIYVVADRRAYIEAHNAELTDQVIVGNAEFADRDVVFLDSADGYTLQGVATDGMNVIVFDAKSQDKANEMAAAMPPQLTAEDVGAGLEAQYLMVVAEPVDGKEGEYKAVVAVNPETVNAPVIAEPAAECEPVEIEEDDNGKTTVSVSISNAVKGLWYGYEVSDELGDASMFVNDVPSFERAKGTAHTVTGSSRTQPSGFFRLKVLPAKPSK